MDHLNSVSCSHDFNVSFSTMLRSNDALDAEISRDNQDAIANAKDYLTGASRGGGADSIIDNEEGYEMNVMQLSVSSRATGSDWTAICGRYEPIRGRAPCG